MASMRPQHIAAEYTTAPDVQVAPETSFNEAAAYRCGIRFFQYRSELVLIASMRPQHIAAEYTPQSPGNPVPTPLQ